MKYTFSITKTEYNANLAVIEEWLHSIVKYEFGWLGNDHYYIVVDGLDEDDAIVYNIKYKMAIVKIWSDDES